MPVLSYLEAMAILRAIDEKKHRVRVLLDLGLSPNNVDLNYRFKEAKVSGCKMSFANVEEMSADSVTCYYLEKGKQPQKLRLFSIDTNKFYKLVPTTDAPTLEISGIKMHRTSERTPWQDTLDKIDAVSPLKGRVLDTCCCLGYTAIAAAKEKDVSQVFTFEKDSNVLELADYNPWSKELYFNQKIKLTVGNVDRGVEMFSTKFFDSIIHDPPRFALSPELYSTEFYRKLNRVLKSSGKLYHYVGNPGEKLGKDFVRGVMNRLKEVGFRKVKRRDDILGVTAQKATNKFQN